MSEAVAVSNDFYANLINGNYTGANRHMHPDALKITNENEWVKIYRNAQLKTGKLAFVKMFDYGIKLNMKGGNGMGDYAELIFDAQYKEGNLREKLTFYRKDSTESVRILGYEYNQIVDKVFVDEILRK